MAGTCPRCGGPQMEGHPAGLLAIQHRISCSLLAAEDATQAADYLRGNCERAPTDAERELLTALGYDLPVDEDEDVVTVVEYITHSVRRRTWPDLAAEGDAEPDG